jgi:sugar phosphate isomerase/epimerase
MAAYTTEEIRDRLSISTFVFWGHRPVDRGAFEELASHGIERIELLESLEQYDMTDASSMKLMGEACRSAGIQVVAFHCFRTDFNEVEDERARRDRVDRCRRQIDTMLELGGTLWGCHAKEANSIVVKSFEELARHIEGTEAVITVENTTRGPNVEDRVEFLDAMDHPQVGMILDIGHVRNDDRINPMTLKGGPTQVLETCGHRLRHIHLHGFKDGGDHHPPLVEGDEIQWAELFGMLRQVAYSGAINFEPRRHEEAIEYTARAPEGIAERLAQAG